MQPSRLLFEITETAAVADTSQAQSFVAKYVGDEETLCLLQQFGVDYGQGFFLGKPEKLADSLSRDWSSGPPGANAARECVGARDD